MIADLMLLIPFLSDHGGHGDLHIFHLQLKTARACPYEDLRRFQPE